MNRRALLATLGTVAVAGCLAADDGEENDGGEDNSTDGSQPTESTSPGENVESVDVNAESHTDEDPAVDVTVRWNSRAQSGVVPDPDEWVEFTPDDGNKYVVVRGEITVDAPADGPVDVRRDLLQLRTDGVYHTPQMLAGGPETLQATVDPGTTYDGWNVYEIGEDATEAVLVTETNAYRDGIDVTFEHVPDLDVDMAAP